MTTTDFPFAARANFEESSLMKLRSAKRIEVERVDITQNRMAHASELVAQFGEMRLDGRPLRYEEAPVHILYTDYSMSKGQSLWNSVNILVELMLR